MRFILKLAAILSLSTLGMAQSTFVTATVSDTSGQTWNNGTYAITFIPTPGKPGPFYWNGVLYNPQGFTGALDGSGAFSVALPDNSFITPSGTQWKFIVCPQASFACHTVQTAVTGTSMSLTTAISANNPPIQFNPTPFQYGYSDSEVLAQPGAGQQYFNVTSKQPEYWDGSAWQDFPTGGSFVQTGPTGSQTVTQPVNTNLNVITSGTGQFTYNGSNILTSASAGGSAIVPNPSGNQTVTQPVNTVFNFITSGTGAVEHGGNPILDTTTGLQLSPSGPQSVTNTTTFTHLGDFTNVTCASWRGVLNVKDCGAKGDGSTDDTTAIQTALNAVQAGGSLQYHELYFPCGVYITSAQLTLTNTPNNVAPHIVGESPSCAIIQYTGSSTATAVFEATSGNTGLWGAGLVLDNMAFYGNANITYDLYIFNQAQYYVSNVSMWGANTTTGQCLNLNSTVAATIINPTCHPYSSTPTPHDGIVIDGLGATNATVPMVMTTPDIVNVPGKALWMKNVNGAQISGCQISNIGIGLYMENSASQNHIDTCLFEGFTLGSVPQTANDRIAGNNNIISNSQFTSDAGYGAEIAEGTGNQLVNTYTSGVSGQSLLVDTGVASTVLNGVKVHGGVAGISDRGNGTVIINSKSDNSSDQVTQDQATTVISPAVNWNGGGASVMNTSTSIHGSFPFGSTPLVMSPTIINSGKSWRAVFIGEWQEFSGATASQYMPPIIELTETNNAVTMPSGAVITFTVNGSSLLQAVANVSCCEIFQGFIYFMPNLSGSSSNSGPAVFQFPDGALIESGAGTPSGACVNGSFYTSSTGTTINNLWVCGSTAWQLIH